jgi:hypothetical protein
MIQRQRRSPVPNRIFSVGVFQRFADYPPNDTSAKARQAQDVAQQASYQHGQFLQPFSDTLLTEE